jgi:hypothetical protein
MKFLALSFLAALTSVGAPAHADDATAAFARLAGTYSPDCGNPAAARAVVEPARLRVVGVKRPLTAARSDANPGFLGEHAPSDFVVALVAKLKNGNELVFMVHEDEQGRYLRLAADVAVERSLGKAVGGAYRLCGGA